MLTYNQFKLLRDLEPSELLWWPSEEYLTIMIQKGYTTLEFSRRNGVVGWLLYKNQPTENDSVVLVDLTS